MKSKGLIKIGLSIVLLFLVAKSVHLQELRTTFESIPPSTAFLVIAGYFVSQLLSSIKWFCILRSGGINVSYPTTFKAYFIGMFTNIFGLGMVGGDVARAMLVTQGLPKKAEGLAAVVVDRIQGLIILILIALTTSFLLGHPYVPTPLLQGLLILCIGFIVFWILGPWLLTRVPIIQRLPFAHHLTRIAAVFPRDPKTILAISLISVVFHTVQILLHQVMAVGVGTFIPWSTLFTVIPIVNTAASIPISWQGLGVREKSYATFLTPPGILSQGQVIALGAIWLLAVTASSAIGGVIAIATGDMKLLKKASTSGGESDARSYQNQISL